MTPALPRPDFLRPVARPGLLAWAWCGTGLLVLSVSAAEGLSAWQARELALDRLARASRPAPAPAAAAPGAPVNAAAPAARAAAAARQAESDRWRQQLALPWPAVWAAAEAAPGGVQWLLLEHGPAGLRLAGLATDTGPAEAAAAALRAQQHGGAPAWRGVTLAAIERVADGQRVELVARLAAGTPVPPTPGPQAP